MPLVGPGLLAPAESKWYLHLAADASTGANKPAAKQSSVTPTDAVTAVANRRQATPIIGTAFQTLSKTSSATTSAQKNFFTDIFIVQSALAAQTFGAGSWTINGTISESNSNANFGWSCCIYVWNPAGNALRGRIFDGPVTPTLIGTALAATGNTLKSGTVTGSNVTSVAGDLLVIEFWETSTQGMSTSYTDSILYDGTTEASTTNPATYFSSPVPVYINVAGYPPGPEQTKLQAINRQNY